MDYVTDTHPLVWYFTEDRQLSKKAFPHLTLTQIHDSLSYYYEHKSELDEAYKKDQLFTNELRKHYPSRLKTRLKI